MFIDKQAVKVSVRTQTDDVEYSEDINTSFDFILFQHFSTKSDLILVLELVLVPFRILWTLGTVR